MKSRLPVLPAMAVALPARGPFIEVDDAGCVMDCDDPVAYAAIRERMA